MLITLINSNAYVGDRHGGNRVQWFWGFRPTPSRAPLVLIIVPDLDLTLARASRP